MKRRGDPTSKENSRLGTETLYNLLQLEQEQVFRLELLNLLTSLLYTVGARKFYCRQSVDPIPFDLEGTDECTYNDVFVISRVER